MRILRVVEDPGPEAGPEGAAGLGATIVAGAGAAAGGGAGGRIEGDPGQGVRRGGVTGPEARTGPVVEVMAGTKRRKKSSRNTRGQGVDQEKQIFKAVSLSDEHFFIYFLFSTNR